jgi:hypothetical protein
MTRDQTRGYPGEGPRKVPTWKVQTLGENDLSKPRLAKRGALAWQSGPVSPLAASIGMPNLLHVHAVADTTGLYAYVPAVRRWLQWCAQYNAPMNTVSQMDLSLADYLAYGCYMESFAIAEGRNALWGALYIFPEMIGAAPNSQRALKSWDRLAVTGEGSPIPLSFIMLLWQTMHANGDHEAADIAIVATDCYLRSSDWMLIQMRDITSGTDGMAIQLGIPERGESTKTGTRQGVRPDYDLTRSILASRLSSRKSNERLFDLTSEQFRAVWTKTCSQLKWWPGPPHALRHSGPSHDALHNYRNIDQIRIRGRWRAKTSVLRYMKTHTLIAVEASLPPPLRQAGMALLPKLGARALLPVQ